MNIEIKDFLKEYLLLVFEPRRILSGLIGICFLTIAGPFDTYSTLSIIERFSFWGLVVVLAVLFMTLAKLIVSTVLPQLSFWQNGFAISAGFTVFFTPVLVVVTERMTSGHHLHTMPVWMQFVVVFAFAMAITQLRFLLFPSVTVTRPKLFERFENKLITKIYRVTVRDHHVDVFTDCGTETLLMRFSDAIAELDGLRGNQVHRSHWVACAEMLRLDRSNGRYLLELTDGSKVPVSRSYRAKVEARIASGPASERPSALVR